jgi:hypothetical protein
MMTWDSENYTGDEEMKKTVVVIGLVVAVMAMMVAPAFAAGEAMVRVTHASPDAPAVDVCVNGSVAFANLAFGKTTDYAKLPSGSYDVQVYPAGSNCQGTAVIDAKGLKLDAKAYTVMAIDTLANIKPLILVDNLAAPAAGKVHVRFVHASPDAPAVDITTADGTKVFSNVAFGKSVDFTPLPAGTYDLQARVAGTDTVALNLPGVNLPEGAILTVVAEGFASGAEPKLGVQVISYPAMTAAPATLPVSGGETSANNAWVLLMGGAALVAMGFGWRYARNNAR